MSQSASHKIMRASEGEGERGDVFSVLTLVSFQEGGGSVYKGRRFLRSFVIGQFARGARLHPHLAGCTGTTNTMRETYVLHRNFGGRYLLGGLSMRVREFSVVHWGCGCG